MSNDEIGPGESAQSSEKYDTDSSGAGFTGDHQARPTDQASAGQQDGPTNGPEPVLPIRLWRRFQYWRRNPFRVRATKPNVAEWITVFVTIVIAIIGALQYSVYRQQKKIMESSGPQTQKLIDAAEIQAGAATKNATAANSFATSAGGINTELRDAVGELKESATNTHTLALTAKEQAENTKDSIRQGDQAFRISQQPYLTIGRKDGIVAEIEEPKEPDHAVDIILYVQNAGRLPARTACISTTFSAFPVVGPGGQSEQRNPLMRQRGKDGKGRMRVMESSCPTIGGDSAFAFVISPPFMRDVLRQVRTNVNSQIMVSAVVQYCDPFGKYFCKSTTLQYLRDPIATFHEISELDLSRHVQDGARHTANHVRDERATASLLRTRRGHKESGGVHAVYGMGTNSGACLGSA